MLTTVLLIITFIIYSAPRLYKFINLLSATLSISHCQKRWNSYKNTPRGVIHLRFKFRRKSWYLVTWTHIFEVTFVSQLRSRIQLKYFSEKLHLYKKLNTSEQPFLTMIQIFNGSPMPFTRYFESLPKVSSAFTQQLITVLLIGEGWWRQNC